ncbi:hypothetical protein POM88_047266 [Heracleum sosnowskyi]|uniref:Aminotransferase-like plant mobile domain-containing protein n=1 Tax=Heracleum sosnowskyi TaxID=360622 RepID=A0AAD8GTS4_9APIA|nr:hypothetical protein POM88_047266 [Heracleum sosnowskyi]
MDDFDVADLELNPGPKDPSVLHLQEEHRSTNIWKAGGGDNMRSRVRTKFTSVHSRMVPYLRDMHFDGVARLTSIHIDWSLVTALVERWRPETHTFHLPTGECTITLQDVSILLGLRVDGRAITGSTEFKGGWTKIVQEMFGKAPSEESKDLNGGRLKLSWLSKTFLMLPDDADEDEVIRHTHAFMLQLIGGVLFTDHQGSQIHCMFIPLIQNLERCSKLSWGSGVLAFLYRELCKACKIGVEEIAGCVLLLQLWAWTRLPTLAPVPRGPCLDNQDIWGDLNGPFGLRWCAPKSFTDFNVLDRISLIARGEITGDIRSIDALASEGRRLLEYQYSRGLNQDFQCDDRVAKQELVRGKAKRTGHKGGRGGVNAPKRRAIERNDGHIDHVDEEGSVHLGDDVGAHVVDDVEISNAPHTSYFADLSLQSNVLVGDTVVHTVYEAGASDVHFTPPSSHPTFQLLSPGDFQWPPRQEHLDQQEQPAIQHQTPQPRHDEKTESVEQTPPLSHPTFQLLSPSDFQCPPQPEPVSQKEQPVDQQNSIQPQQPHQVEEQQQHLVEEHQEPREEQQQQVGEEQPMEEQVDEEQPMHEPDQQVVERHMRLRPRNNKGVKCGTDGCKQYMRLR